MKENPDQAFIMAAGKGTRMRPLTETCPKPMVEVAGRPIIERTLDKLEAAGVCRVAVNLYHLSKVLEDHLSQRKSPEIIFSKESELLDTGGGVKNAESCLRGEPFYLINGDALWTDPPGQSALDRLSQDFDPDIMDMLLLLYRCSDLEIGRASGDYDLDDSGRAVLSENRSGSFMFTGIRIVHPRILEDAPEGAFSFLELMKRSEKAGRLFGIVHKGQWYHISTPEDLEAANRVFSQGRN
jgi:MurNAc alpha-1-phosphate uridylyltransferase